MIRSWRILVALPLLVLTTDWNAQALERTAGDRYATDTLLCRGPFKITYVDQAGTMKEHTWRESKNGIFSPDPDQMVVSGTWLSAHLEIPITTVTGSVGLGLDLEPGQCGWVQGKNPAADTIILRGEWTERAEPLRRYIEVDTAGNQTVRYTFALSGTAGYTNALWLFKVPHQGHGNDETLLVETEPKLTFPKFKKP
jgi:hypothetical protein